MDDEIVRILVSTDNHLGFMEKDHVRGDDSFASFQEIFLTAKSKRADMIVLAGDLFHENKPSRRTIHTATTILRKNCLGESPVFIEVLNDQAEIFKSNSGIVNYEDPFHSICLPVFAIHGNHDDPSREGGREGEALAALDLLAASNLVNYIGKIEQIEDIEITPVLIRKGGTHIALYGLGAVRDERLNRLWNMKKVRFSRPSLEQGRDRFFSIFVLHQNRDYGRGSKNCIHESMIPDWMDLVIWGNEHEAIPHLVESLVGTYRIYQPGSSVSTSLVDGESTSHPKSMGFIEIRPTKEFRLKATPYTQVRPFVFRDICLSDMPGLDAHDAKIEDTIRQLLTETVADMIEEARGECAKMDTFAMRDQLDYKVREPRQVLIRLRVDHFGFPTINQQRFGAQFVGQVANPSDVLSFFRKAKVVQTGKAGTAQQQAKGTMDFQRIFEDGEEDEIHKIRIEDLVTDTLTTSNKRMHILPEEEMAKALEDFVIRRYPNAIVDTVSEALEHMQLELSADVPTSEAASERGPVGRTAIAEAAARVKKKTEEALRKGDKVFKVRAAARSAMAEDSDEDGPVARRDDEEQEEEDDEPFGERAAGMGKRGGGKAAGSGAAATKGKAKGKVAAPSSKAAAKLRSSSASSLSASQKSILDFSVSGLKAMGTGGKAVAPRGRAGQGTNVVAKGHTVTAMDEDLVDSDVDVVFSGAVGAGHGERPLGRGSKAAPILGLSDDDVMQQRKSVRSSALKKISYVNPHDREGDEESFGEEGTPFEPEEDDDAAGALPDSDEDVDFGSRRRASALRGPKGGTKKRLVGKGKGAGVDSRAGTVASASTQGMSGGDGGRAKTPAAHAFDDDEEGRWAVGGAGSGSRFDLAARARRDDEDAVVLTGTSSKSSVSASTQASILSGRRKRYGGMDDGAESDGENRRKSSKKSGLMEGWE